MLICQLPPQISRSRGAALLTVIMVTAVLAIVASAMLVSQHLSIYETGLVTQTSRWFHALQGMQNMVRQDVLLLALKKHKPPATFAKNYGQQTIDGVQVSGSVADAQGRFNINLLRQTANRPVFARLLQTLDHSLAAKDAMALSIAVSEWVMADKSGAGKAPHLPMALASELRLVPGISAAWMQKLAPFVIALPQKTKVNINAASAPVFYSLLNHKGIDMGDVKSVLQCRNAMGGFSKSKDVTRCLQAQNMNSSWLDMKLVSFNSQYFLLTAKAAAQDQVIPMQSLIALQSRQAAAKSEQASAQQSQKQSTGVSVKAAALTQAAATKQVNDWRAIILWQAW